MTLLPICDGVGVAFDLLPMCEGVGESFVLYYLYVKGRGMAFDFTAYM